MMDAWHILQIATTLCTLLSFLVLVGRLYLDYWPEICEKFLKRCKKKTKARAILECTLAQLGGREDDEDMQDEQEIEDYHDTQ